ncbi:MAG: hypothetical protein ACFFDN_20475, partial [Candidatus Hodarchaeota archaeon]
YRQASIGVLWAITIGYGIYLLTYFIDPLLVSMFNWSIIGYFSELHLIQISLPNHLYYVSLGFTFLTNIPACFGWFFGGIILGSYYKKKNAHFNGVKGSWKSFQIVIMAIELFFIGSAFYYLICYLIGINFMSISLFFGGLLLSLFTLFFTPGFWLSLSFILMGGIMGSKFTKPIKVPPTVKKVPKILIEPGAKPEIAEPTVAKARVKKTTPSIKIEEADTSAKIPTSPPIIEKIEITEEDLKITEEILRTGKCPKCNNPFPVERLKMIQKGNDTFCPNCFQVVYAIDIKRKRDDIKKIFRVGVELISQNKEKAKASFEDALDLAKEIKDDELIEEIEEIIRKIK